MRYLTSLLIVLSCHSFAGDKPLDNGWPREWFEPMKTASEVGITQFSQSPALDALDLPPVKERLPDDPAVVVPLAEIGQYGGTVRTTTNEWLTFPNEESLLTISADMRTILPNLAESWQVRPDGRRITLTLRKGIKWSDGMPLTSDDFVFVFNDILLNKEYAPVTLRMIEGGKAVKVTDHIFYYEFDQPRPLMENYLAQYGSFMVFPAHYFRNFHPDYVDRETLDRKIKNMGFISWMVFYSALRNQAVEESADPPTLASHKIVRRLSLIHI